MKMDPLSMSRHFPYCSLMICALALFCGNVKAVLGPPIFLGISPLTSLSFSNLTVGSSYQLQQRFAWYWTNMPVSFTATNPVYSQMITGAVQGVNYRLALIPVPDQAFAVAQVANGSVTGVTITDGGSGYFTPPTVLIVRRGGTNATAITAVSDSGIVTNIVITSAGMGYTNAPLVEIAPPPAVAIQPQSHLVVRLNAATGTILQFTPGLTQPWQTYGPVTSTPMDLVVTNDTGFYRIFYP